MLRIARVSVPIFVSIGSICVTAPAIAQQGPDTSWTPNVARPAYTGAGPRVGIDEAHRNFHTATGNYRPFAELLRRDGYRVSASTQPFTRVSLSAYDVLVIANARGGDDAETVANPAFTAEERAALREWVRGGGSLLLIADHAPFGAAAEALGMEFGVGMLDSVAAALRAGGRRDTSVVAVQMRPVAPASFSSAAGRAQGVALPFGAGRVVVLGEAAMLSAQVVEIPGRETIHMGMNVPGTDDRQFALNVMHWLSRLF